MSWLHYRNSMSGEIVDRYRWDAGCIVEHVSNHSPRPLDFNAVVPETNDIESKTNAGSLSQWDQGEKYPGTT